MSFSINLESPLCQEIFNTSCYMTSYFPQFWFLKKETSFYLHPGDIDGEDGTSKLKQGFPRWISDTHNTLPSVEICVHSDLLICAKVIMYIICFCMSSPVSLLLYSLQKKPGVPGTATFLKHREESLKSLKLFVFGRLLKIFMNWTMNHQIICGIVRSLFYKIVTRTWPLWWFHIIVIQVDTWAIIFS